MSWLCGKRKLKRMGALKHEVFHVPQLKPFKPHIPKTKVKILMACIRTRVKRGKEEIVSTGLFL